MTTTSPDGRDDVNTGFPDIVDDAAPERGLLVDPQEPALPGDDYLAADEFGTTVAEQLDGESLDSRLAREEPEPDVDPLAPSSQGESDAELDRDNRLFDDPEGAFVGRLVEPDEGAHTDIEKDAVAREAHGEHEVSAEEAAMHIEPEV